MKSLFLREFAFAALRGIPELSPQRGWRLHGKFELVAGDPQEPPWSWTKHRSLAGAACRLVVEQIGITQ